jgi:phospholipid/cholesterol/gamma-HCH transport system permease protein
MRQILGAIGRESMDVLARAGSLLVMQWAILRSFFPPRFDREEVWRQLNRIGVASLPIIALTSFLVGATMVIQVIIYVRGTGATKFIGAGLGLAVMAELGPTLIGLMFSGRVGANTTAEFGNMVVSEQIDALKALAIDPIKFLVAPRFIAIVSSLVLLVAVGDLLGIVGGMLTAHWLLHLDYRTFLAGLLDIQMMDTFVVGLIKGFFFGTVIATTSTTFGLSVSGGAKGVGAAVNGSVVTTAIGIFLSDYFVTYWWIQWLEAW